MSEYTDRDRLDFLFSAPFRSSTGVEFIMDRTYIDAAMRAAGIEPRGVMNWEPKVEPRNATGTQGYHAPFVCPFCHQPAELWCERFKGGHSHLRVNHIREYKVGMALSVCLLDGRSQSDARDLSKEANKE